VNACYVEVKQGGLVTVDKKEFQYVYAIVVMCELRMHGGKCTNGWS